MKLVGKKFWQVILAGLIAVSFILGCAACGGGNDNKITIFLAFPDDGLAESAYIRKLEEKSGMDIEIQFLTGEKTQVIGTMLAGGTYPDIIYANDSTKTIINAGVALSMDEYLKTGGENMKAIYGADLDRARMAEGGSLYFLPDNRGDSDALAPFASVFISQRVLAYYAETHNGEWPVVKTLDQYFDLIEAYKTTHPLIALKNSQGRTVRKEPIGTILLADVNYDYCVQGAPLQLGGFPNDGNLMVDQETLQCTSIADSEYAYKFFKKLNSAYNRGLIKQDTFTMTYSDFVEQLTQGAVLGALYTQNQYMTGPNSVLLNQNPESFMVPMPVVLEEGLEERYATYDDIVVYGGLLVTDNCKNPEKAFDLIDLMCSEEMQRYMHWGTEGVTYEVDENGTYYRTDEQVAYLRISENYAKEGLFPGGFPRGRGSARYSDGNYWSPYSDPDYLAQSLHPVEKEFLSHYNIKIYNELFHEPTPTIYGQAWTAEDAQYQKAIVANEDGRNAMRLYHPRLVKAENDAAFEEAWKSFVNDPRIVNHKTYADCMTLLIRQRANLWYGKNFEIDMDVLNSYK